MHLENDQQRLDEKNIRKNDEFPFVCIKNKKISIWKKSVQQMLRKPIFITLRNLIFF